MKNFSARAGDFAAIVTAVLLGAGLIAVFVSQLVFNIAPCALCFQQRWPYFVGIPLAIGIAHLDKTKLSGNILRCAEVSLLAVLAWSLFLAIQHSGVEWSWWPAPAECTAATPSAAASVNDLQLQLKKYVFVPCDKPSWKLFGILSFANLNALLSGFLLLLNLSVFAGYDPRRLYGSSTVSQ